MDHREAEVLVIHRQTPVVRLVLGVEIGVEVEEIPVGVGGIAAGGVDFVGILGVGHQGGEQIGGDVGAVHAALHVHGGGDGAGLGVILLLDGVDKDLLGLPVGGVPGHDALVLGLIGAEDKGAAVPQELVGGAEAVAGALQQGGAHGHVGAHGHHGHEVGPGGGEGILQGVLVKGAHADVLGAGLVHRLEDLPGPKLGEQ